MRRTPFLLAITSAVCLFCSTARAAVTTTLDLTTAAGENELTLELFLGPASAGSDVSILTGTIELELVLDSNHDVTQFRMTGGSFDASEWAIEPFMRSNGITGGTFLTPQDGTPGPDYGDVSNGMYDASAHELLLNRGTVTATFPPNPDVTFDFATDDLEVFGSGQGLLNLTATGDPTIFDARLEFPLQFSTEVAPGSGVFLNITGNVVATGIVAVPEASSFALLAVLAMVLGMIQLRMRSVNRRDTEKVTAAS